jgi:hypothetical protein
MNSGRQPPKSSGAAHHGTGPFSLGTATTSSAARSAPHPAPVPPAATTSSGSATSPSRRSAVLSFARQGGWRDGSIGYDFNLSKAGYFTQIACRLKELEQAAAQLTP